MNAQNIKELFMRQKFFFQSQKTHSICFRIQQLKNLRKSIKFCEKSLYDALFQDLGKPEFESYIGEFFLIYKEIDFALKRIRQWNCTKKITNSLHMFPAQSYLFPEPRGVVLIIAPWNYPLQLLFMPLIGAIAAGNCIILKPSEHAPATTEIIENIIRDTFDPAYISVISGGIEETQTLLSHPFDYIFFTGSSHVGKIIMRAASEHLTPLTLELGGKSPCIVDKEVVLSCAAKRIVWGKYFNAGQNCISPDYVMVHRSQKDMFIKKLIYWITQFYGQDPSSSNSYARIINEKHFDRLCALMQYGSIIWGGKSDRQKKYIEPTIMDSVDLNSQLMQEEIFGPILPIISFDVLEEVITFIQTKPKPLALYLFSYNKKNIERILFNTSSGGAIVNDVMIHASSSYLPFGGVGISGFGSYHGKASFDTFTHYKPIVYQNCRVDNLLRYPPYSKFALWLIKKLF